MWEEGSCSSGFLIHDFLYSIYDNNSAELFIIVFFVFFFVNNLPEVAMEFSDLLIV